MRRRALAAAAAVVLAGAGLAVTARSRAPSDGGARTVQAVAGPFSLWTTYEAALSSSAVTLVQSGFSGNATIVEIVPEGTRVKAGDLLVRFDATALQREVLKLERDFVLAKSDLESTRNAKLPLEERDLELKSMEAAATLEAERQYLDACLQFQKERLMSAHEVEQQRAKVGKLKVQVETLRMQRELARDYLHPAELKRGEARLASAEQELTLAREQLRNATLRAPADGVVVYRTVYVGSEYRTVRVGDTIVPNQPFLVLPDLTKLVVTCEVPENELSRVREGSRAVIEPLAFPDVRSEGVVETVASVALGKPDQPQWRKFFTTLVAVKDPDPRLKPGMTVKVRILSYEAQRALSLPRAAVRWDSGAPYVKLAGGRTRALRLGMANEQAFEVLDGLREGEPVLLDD